MLHDRSPHSYAKLSAATRPEYRPYGPKKQTTAAKLARTAARAGERYTAATGVRALNATALHYAAKAGFVQTIRVLLESGADPAARDSRGRTPLDWLEQAAPSVSRAAVRDLLAP